MASKHNLSDDDDTLTEFGPVPESPDDSFSWGNFFKWRKVTKLHRLENKQPPSVKGFYYNTKHGRVVEVEQTDIVEESTVDPKSNSKIDVEVHTKRFSNVIRKISNALDRTSNTSNQYSENDFKQYWMPDSDCKECYDCGDRFTTFRRRHHCRICGQVFCSSCCNQEIPGKLVGCRVDLRVCVYCCKVVLSCLQTTDWTAQSSVDFKILQDQLLVRLGMADNQTSSGSGLSRFPKIGTGFNEHGINQSQSSLASSLQDYRSSELSNDEDRLSVNEKSNFINDLDQTMDIASSTSVRDILIQPNIEDIEPSWVSRVNRNYSNIHQKGTETFWDSTEETSFPESGFRVTNTDGDFQVVSPDKLNGDNGITPNTVDSVNRLCRDSYDGKDDAIRAGTFSASAVAAAEVVNLIQKTGELNSEQEEVLKHLSLIYEKYENAVVHQLLERHCLPHSWSEIILPIVHQIVNSVKLNTYRNRGEMDIRPCVQIKKIAGGEKSDCAVINGVVFTKNVAHKKMRSTIISPTILLIKSPIIYQRQENKFLSLEPALLQESSYLRNVVAKIIALKPDVVLVENTVSRLAQTFFLDANITLLLNVKPSVMNRIARVTNANVTTSIDAHFPKPQLGTCKMMSLTSYDLPSGFTKTLIKFDGCDAHLGCTVLLRGSSIFDLCKVKRIMKFMIFMNFNQKLEMSFLSDETALPPNLKDITCLKKGVSNVVDDLKCLTVDNLEVPDFNVCDQNLPVWTSLSSLKYKSIREALKDLKLSISPSINFEPPFFEDEELIKIFPDLIYYSSYLEDDSSQCSPASEMNECAVEDTVGNLYLPLLLRCNLQNDHPFIWAQFSNPVFHSNIQSLLANFRAKGGCYYNSTELSKRSSNEESENCNNYGNDFQLDVLDPFNHQSISVLFCSYSYQSSNSPYFCIDPWIVRMEFYGSNDITLGGFLEKYCFRTAYACPNSTCDALMINHVRRFVHNDGCIYILLHKLEIPISSWGPDSILVWSWCRKCKVSTKITSMSSASRVLSFAKYLDLRFYNHSYVEGSQKHCVHSLHRDHYQYFACRDIIAAFKYSTIPLHEVKLPKTTLHKYIRKEEEPLVDEIRTLAVSGHGIFDTIMEKLHNLTLEPLSSKKEIITDRITQLQQEKNSFREKVKEIQIKLSSTTDSKMAVQQNLNCNDLYEIIDNILCLKRHLVETVLTWNLRLTDCFQQKRKEDRSAKQANISKQTIVTPSDHHDSELVVTKSATPRSSTQSMETLEDDKALEEPCLDYFSDVSINETVDVGDQNLNNSSEILDGNKILESCSGVVEKDSGMDTPKSEKKSTMIVKNMISQLLSLPSAVTLQMPFPSNEHHMLPHCEKVPLVVYDNEPSSIIAYALCSADYELGIQEMKHSSDNFKPNLHKEMKDTNTKLKTARTFEKTPNINEEKCGIIRENYQVTDDSPEMPIKDDLEYGNPHLDVQFADNSAKFYCRVYFAKQFLKLREEVLPEGEEQFIRCLSRCSEWQANGGKSGCLFCKTHDDRFILKQMTRLEVQSFLEFAPHYIDYMLQASSEQKPAALVKILGAFQITHRQISHSNASVKMDLLVMENLFYGHDINKTFDLKGSIRNRLVNVTGKDGSDVVLQDENLLKMACDYPLYVKQHSKMILSFAIQNDTRFLSNHLIMDYSLLVGVNEVKKELVVGIIDYIRTFTWDKKLENLVKSTGILGGQGRTPTVISPELYRNRFCEAMDRYILLVPDQWHDLGSMDL